MRAPAALAIAAALAGCQPTIAPDSYAAASVGQAQRTVRGTVLASRLVAIEGSRSGVGAGAGAIAGGAGASAIGGGTRANIAAGVGGAVLGGIVGALAEDAVTRQQGAEYIVQTEGGALVTIVQGAEPPLATGQRVLVIYGARARVIADPTAAPAPVVAGDVPPASPALPAATQ